MATYNFKTIKVTGYKRCTRAQLISLIKKYQTEIKKVSTASEWATFPAGKTQLQYGLGIKKQLKLVSQFLRDQVLWEIDAKITYLTTQMAARLGVPMNSPKARSAAVKRLEAKYRKIAGCRKISKLLTMVRTFKVSSFKNPKFTARKVGSTVGKSYRKTTGRKTSKYVGSKRKGAKFVGKIRTAKIRTESKKLKREISKLKSRNTFLRKQVNKFRSEVAKMQRHYSTLNKTSGGWNVVKGGNVGKEVSNIVRLSNALTNAIDTRKAG